MNVFKKYKKPIIGVIIGIVLFSAGFCAGRYRRLGVLESDSNRIESTADAIGDNATSAGISIESAGSLLDSSLNFGQLANGYINAATILAIEQGNTVNELIRTTEAYKGSIQLAESSINDLFDLSIRKAELNEEFIRKVIELSESSSKGIGQ